MRHGLLKTWRQPPGKTYRLGIADHDALHISFGLSMSDQIQS
jgi:hypothetical protein